MRRKIRCDRRKRKYFGLAWEVNLLVATDVALAFNATSAVEKKMLDTVQFGHIYMNDPIPSLYLPAIYPIRRFPEKTLFPEIYSLYDIRKISSQKFNSVIGTLPIFNRWPDSIVYWHA
jgi:hypothetical protein